MSGKDDEEVCQRICSEARDTLDQQIYRNEQVDQKALGIFRLNLLLMGLLLTVFTLIVNTDVQEGRFINVWSIGALILLLISTLFAAMTYTSTSYDVGISIDTIEDSKYGRYDSTTDFERDLRDIYKEALDHNNKIGQFNAYFITIAIVGLLNSIILFTGAIGVGFSEFYKTPVSAGLFILSLVSFVVVDLLIWKADWIFAKIYSE